MALIVVTNIINIVNHNQAIIQARNQIAMHQLACDEIYDNLLQQLGHTKYDDIEDYVFDAVFNCCNDQDFQRTLNRYCELQQNHL